MRKIKIRTPKRLRLPKNTPLIICPDLATYYTLKQKQYERHLFDDLWGRMLAALRGETYEETD